MNIFFMHKKRQSQGSQSSGRFLVKKNSWNKKTIWWLVFGIGFFTFAVLAYKFQGIIPRIPADTGALIRPDFQAQGSSTFKKELKRYNIQFESILLATQSSTLIVKLPHGAYAYFNATMDPVSQAKLLASILSRVSIDNKGKTLKYVDLTHEKAIVQF